MNRRGFLASILAAGVAPAAVGSSILMPIKALVLPTLKIRWPAGMQPAPRAYMGGAGGGKSFVVLVHSDIEIDLRREFASELASPEKLFRGEMFRLQGIRFVRRDAIA